ncbi:DUF748 domain-containing protein [uncultured Piscinibacter sp.]|uniref:DUF748 domain-containing protein n=1 Tax=uncultured Piscinibacter sp. TaxID=1131835 RepID=UPI002632D866|nr:DUF748 domain-containing protein [uncultured Piscinibacter sp.]
MGADSAVSRRVAAASGLALSRLGAWPRRLAIAMAVLLALWALAWLAVPPILKSQAQGRLSALLGRSVSLAEVDFRPWSLELTVRDLEVGPSAGSEQPLLRWSRAYVNADAASLWRRAPVFSAIELDGVQIHVARLAPGQYDIDDLLARFVSDPSVPADSEPARFALYNLRLRDAALTFDDRPARRVHRVDSLQVSLPFISSLPAHLEVTVEPHVAFKLDGAAFDSGAQATPFAAQHSGELKMAVAGLDLAHYAPYLPASLPLRLQRGVLSADVALRFELPEGADPRMAVSGSTRLENFAIADAEGTALLDWRHLQIALRDVQPFARRVALGPVKLDGANLHLSRTADGVLNLRRLGGGAAPVAAAASAPASGATSGAAAGSAWQASIEQVDVDDARVRWNDASTRPAAALQFDAIRVQAGKIVWPMRAGTPVNLVATLRSQAAQAPPAGQLAVEAQVGDGEASGTLALSDLNLPELAPYVAQVLLPRLEGRATLKGRFDWRSGADAPRASLHIDDAGIDGLRLVSGSGRAVRDEVALKQITVSGAHIDLLARELELARVVLARPAVTAVRDARGNWNLLSLTPHAAPSAPAAAASAADATPWAVRLKELQLDGGRVRVSDAFASARAADTPLRIDAAAVHLRVQDFTWPARGGAPARVQFGARVAGVTAAGQSAAAPGSVEWNGRLLAEPLSAKGRLRVDRFPVHAFEPYFAEQLPVSLLRAEAAWQGDLDVRAAPAGWAINASGDARLSDVRVHTRAASASGGGDELLAWQSLQLDGLRFAMVPASTPQLEIREAALSDFFARLVITEQGRLNLSSVAAADGAASAPAATASAAPASASAASAPGTSELPIAVAVGGVKLSSGRIDFSDRFIRPNYSANLTELNGTLGAFRSGTREMATLELRGRAAGTALLDIRGSLNPTADPLALDIQAKATDLELAPLSPYAGKYAGYAIERGKLSMEVAYKISPDGRLEARNQVILNQLTFGDKVDSPDATKLPVLLAVALLKDRNGVIDINLPISGSINDPQFSVFGIVIKVIGNLLVKALTAPFALLAGGGGEDLSLVEFRPGTAFLSDAGRSTLDKVAKALVEREALKMTVTGAADPVSEREAFRQAALEARLLAERRREMLRDGVSAADADALTALDAETRARMLKTVYRATELPNKPRNAFGFARDIPGPEMEALLKAHTAVSTDAMRELALQRGLAVRDALLASGLPGERLFLAAPKLRGSGEDEKAWTPRVQLSLSTR